MRKTHLVLSMAAVIGLSGCNEEKQATGVQPQQMADAIHTVIEADRTAYTKFIVNRLSVEKKVIKASEHWKDEDALLLPAQMFRTGAEIAADKNGDFSYALLSSWPVNKKNKPRTDLEKQGLEAVAKNPDKNFYGTERLGNTEYFTAVYPDVAVAEACISCHNDHKDSPRDDFKLGDVMGGVVVRIALK